MTRSPVLNFLFGMVDGVALGVGAVAYLSVHGTLQLEAQAMTTVMDWEKLYGDAEARAMACEVKFRIGTIIYEPHPVAELPLLHGGLLLTLNQKELRPAWWIPAQ